MKHMTHIARTITQLIAAIALSFALMSAAPSLASAQEAAMPAEVTARLSRDGALRYHYPRYYGSAVAELEPLGVESMRQLGRELALSEVPVVDVWLTQRLDDYFVWHGQASLAPPWAVGLSLTNQYTVLLRQALGQGGTVEELRRTFKHELTHVAIDHARAGQHVPRWFHEGYAQHHAQEWTLERGEQVARMAASGQLIPLRYLDANFPSHQDSVSLAYAQSLHFVRYVTYHHGPDVFGRALARVRTGVPFAQAMEQVTGKSMDTLESEWRHGLTENTTPWSNLADGSFLFVPGALLFMAGWLRRRKQTASKMDRLDDGMERWDYDPQRYRLPHGLHERR
jgi:hypothetical protein